MPGATLPAVAMSPVLTIVTLPDWDSAKMPTELSGAAVRLPAKEIETSP